jgi:hypothetical protein
MTKIEVLELCTPYAAASDLRHDASQVVLD